MGRLWGVFTLRVSILEGCFVGGCLEVVLAEGQARRRRRGTHLAERVGGRQRVNSLQGGTGLTVRV